MLGSGTPTNDFIVWKGQKQDVTKVPDSRLHAIINQRLNRNPANMTGYANLLAATREIERRNS